MAPVPNRAQNYIPISKSKMNFAAQTRKLNPQKGNLAYLEDKRLQKSLQGVLNNKKATVNTSIERANAGRRLSSQGEIALPLPAPFIRGTKSGEVYNPVKVALSEKAIEKSSGIVTTILLIITVFSILSFLLARNASISNVSLNNAAIEHRISGLKQNIGQLKLDITLHEDLSYIQERAAELNMTTPTNNQIVYLQSDNTENFTADSLQLSTQESDGQALISLNIIFNKIKSFFE